MKHKSSSSMQRTFYSTINPRAQEIADSKMINENHMSMSNLPEKYIHEVFNASRFAEKLIMPNDEVKG